MGASNATHKRWATLALVALSLVGTLLFDLSVPLGVAGAATYIVPVLISSRLSDERWTVGIGLLSCLLTLVGYVLSPDSDVQIWKVLTNRGLAILTIAATTVLVVIGARDKRKLAELNQHRQRVERARARMIAQVADNTPNGFLLLGANGKIDYANDPAAAYLAMNAPRLLTGQHHTDVIQELARRGTVSMEGKDPDAVADEMIRSAATDDAVVTFQTTKGRTIQCHTVRLDDASALLVLDDVTETQRQIAEERSRLAAVLNATQSAIIGLSRDGDIVIVNPAARHMLADQFDTLPTAWPAQVQFLNAEDMKPLDASANPVNRALAGQVLQAELSIMSRRDGADPLYVRLSSASLSPETSTQIGTVLVMDDVSEQEKNRQQVERRGRLDALGQLTGGIAHDFNNLLATIEYGVQLAQNTSDAAKRDEYYRTALASVQRGATLTRRLLAFAKQQPGVASSKPAREILDDFEALVRPTIEEAITLEFIADDPDLLVFCDVAQLENALLNLVLNARDAITREGRGNRITVRVRGVPEIDADVDLRRENPHSYIANGMRVEHEQARADQESLAFRYVDISVTDNGPGMDEETKKRAIDPFFTTKKTNSGTGLGLSMVYGFIQQSDGELRIYSEPGKGTVVRLLLPRGTLKGDREQPVERLARPAAAGEVILIVEDEPELRYMMSEVVESFGYVVKQAANGQEALVILQSAARIDLLMTDIVMPGMGGFELAQRAREMDPDLAVIYMSGYTGISESEMGPVKAVLVQKPSPPPELATTIRAVLDRE